MQLRRLVAVVAAVVIVPLTAWSAPGPAVAACPIEGCGGGDPEHTYTSQLTVSRTAGTVTSNTVGGHAISCGATCTITDSQTTGEAERPTEGWPTYTLTASGGPAGYSPSWSPSSLLCGHASTCQVTNDQPSRTVTLGWVDTTAPAVTFNPPTRVGPAGTVWASGSDNSGAVVSYRWTVDGALAGSTGPTLSLGAWSHGQHTVAVRTLDPSGNMSAPVTKAVTVDKAVAVGISPVADFVAAAPVLHLTGDADVVSLACRVDGAAFAPCTSPWAPALADGARTVEVRATDDVGNVATAARAFVMDSMAPALAFTDAPAEGALIAGGATSITVQQVETNPGTLACSVDGTPVGCAPGAAVAITGLAAGAHTFAVTATDKAGNIATLARHFAVQAPAAPTPAAPTPATPGAGGDHAATATRAALRGPARVVAGARARFQVAVSAQSGSSTVPAGLVTWTVDGKRVCRTPLHDGRAICRTARLAPGRHVVVASYAGSGDFAAATVRKVVRARR